MAQYVINTGAMPNDGTGTPLRTAFNDVNLNFNQVFAAGPVGSNIQISNNTITTTNVNGNLILATNGTGIIKASASILPDQPNLRMIGSGTNRFNTVYTQYLDTQSAVISGNLTVNSNLYVAGNTVTVNVADLNVANAVITAAAGAPYPALADGAGLAVGGAGATFLYSATANAWSANLPIAAPAFIGDGSQLTNVAANVNASGMTGNTINANVLYSSLVQVGALNSLSVVGNAQFGQNILSNTITTGEITAIGYSGNGAGLTYVTGANVVGNVANATYATFAGTAGTANLAATATQAVNAQNALNALNAQTANTAQFADIANWANCADTALTAYQANSAVVAGRAETIDPQTSITVTGNIVAGGILTNNYYFANGTPATFGGGTGNYSNANVAAYLPTYSGDLLNLGNITSYGTANLGNTNINSTLTVGVVSAQGNIQGSAVYANGFFFSNGAPFTGAGYVLGDQQFYGNGSSGPYNLTQASTDNAVLVTINGLTQTPGTTYFVVGNTISFSDGINTNELVDIRFLGTGAGGTVNTGNIGFSGDTIYDILGMTLNNGDLSHGSTSSIFLPVNGNTQTPASFINTYGNIVIVAGNGTGTNATWQFDGSGNITLPTNTSSINYANGQPYGGSGGSGTYGNANVAAYLPTYTGNLSNVNTITASGDITAGNLVTEDRLTFSDGSWQSTAFLNRAAIANSLANVTDIPVTIGDGFTTNAAWLFGTDGSFTLSNLGGSGGSISATDVDITLNVSNTANAGGVTYTFGQDGNLTVPGTVSSTDVSASGNIVGTGGLYTGDVPPSTPGHYYFWANTTGIHIGETAAQGIIVNGSGIDIGGTAGVNIYGVNGANVNIGNPTAGNINVTNDLVSTNAITATTYYGDGSNLTNVVANTGNIGFSGNNIFNTQGTGQGIFISPNAGGGLDGEIYLPYNNEAANLTITNHNANIVLATAGDHKWKFDTAGNLTVQGAIQGTSASKLDLFNLGNNTAYLTSTADDSVALYLEPNRAELYANARVAIIANTNGSLKQWSFDADGNMILPAGLTSINYANGLPYGGSVIQANAAPANATSQTLWYDTVSGRTYVYYDDGVTTQWVDASPAGTDFGNVSANVIPLTNNTYTLGNSSNKWSNVYTGNILANSFFYANGQPFTSGGIIQSNTAPGNATSSTLWYDTVSGRSYVYYDDGVSTQWVDAAPAGTDFGNVSANVIPLTTDTYNIGNVSNKWANLYIGNVLTSGVVSSSGNVRGGNINTAGNVSAAGNVYGTNLTTKTTGSWTLAAGVNTVSFTVPANGAYTMWVDGNIPNGIVLWNATVSVSNTNVPAVGTQYGWYYAAGNQLVLTAIPTQIVGTAGGISNATVVTTTSNVFSFDITNNTGSSQVVNWGYITL